MAIHLSCPTASLSYSKRSYRLSPTLGNFSIGNMKKQHGVKPFLRWAGGKQWLSGQLARLIPADIGTYYEPFLGGGSLYFCALPEKAILSDVNPRLVETYQVIKDEPHAVIGALERWDNDEQTYYRIRKADFADCTIDRVAQLIYLNRTCWNGLYRVNRQGKFNVPFGYHGRAVFDAQHLLEVSRALENAKVRCGDFDQVACHAEQGDFVYFDPPYTSLHANSGFTQYNESLFSWEDQQRLGRTAVELLERGCHVVVSNASQDSILELYPGFSHRQMSRHSILAASPKFRRVTTELLLASEPNLFHAIDR